MIAVSNATGRFFGFLAVGSLLLAAAGTGRADPLPQFTGYSRIGHPPTSSRDDKPAPKALAERLIGVTIYYMVLDRQNGTRAKATDTWGVGVSGFDDSFVAGDRNDRDEIDSEARYLYLYQLVNDRPGSEIAIKELTLRLLVEPSEITSWGTFQPRGRKKGETLGLGFSMEFPNPEAGAPKWLVSPVSSRSPGVSDRRYLNPAPANRAPRPYSVAPIRTGKIRDASDSETGRPPESVLLVRNVDFGATEAAPRSGLEAGRKRWAAIRAVWRNAESHIQPRERSTIFGFTSNRPPTLDSAAVGGRALGIGWARKPVEPGAGMLALARTGEAIREEKNGKLDVDSEQVIATGIDEVRQLLRQKNEAGAFPPVSGTLPTPAPATRITSPEGKSSQSPTPERMATAQRFGEPNLGGLASPSVSLGTGVTPGTSSASGLVSAALGKGGSGGGGGGGFSGGSGGGSGGSSGSGSTGSSSANSGTGSSQSSTTTISTSGNADSNTTASTQSLADGKNQSQTVTVETNPAPPAWLLALLGLPAFYFMVRKARRSETNQAREEP